ncbi:DUF3710 domain-containing protein [Corynebacterium pacaense]|uniref:DUF3710 domain-containing protein n=1 Tax=Corynebacterium pacaense TaxID=1816684 RepID=UPI0009B996FE|nr:DUF3710 domain-containing protein [Corynebacterium pacaense]
MALWPFGKKDTGSDEGESTAPSEPGNGTDSGAEPQVIEDDGAVHDAVGGEMGPFDADSVDINDFDLSDFAKGVLDLGSMQIPLPKESEVQVEMGEQGPRMLHIVTAYGRLTPVAFAAPRSAGQWREATKDIAEGMRRDGLETRIEQGPWGREVVGEAKDRVIRILGVDGPRWMLRMTMISPIDRSDRMTELGREVVARSFVRRGDAPILASSPLPVTIPPQLAAQVQQAMQQRAQQAQQAQPDSGKSE